MYADAKATARWHRWFAWRPTTIHGERRWLCVVERCWCERRLGDGYWQYRRIEQDEESPEKT
jgi:hypothetical protein